MGLGAGFVGKAGGISHLLQLLDGMLTQAKEGTWRLVGIPTVRRGVGRE